MLLASLSPAQDIHYIFFDDDEIFAREAVEVFPTPQEIFDKMIRIFLMFLTVPNSLNNL